MKKKIFIALALTVLAACLFAIGVFAADVAEPNETIYLAQSKESDVAKALIDEGKIVVTYDELLSSTYADAAENSAYFDKYTDGTHVEMVLIEDIFVPKTIVPSNIGILIRKAITFTVKFNGFSLYIDSQSNTEYNGIVVRNRGALIRLIGTKAKDENGNISSDIVRPSGDIAEGTFNTTGCHMDVFKYSRAFVDLYAGSAYAENLRGTAEKGVFRGFSGNIDLIELKDCALFASNNYSVDIMSHSATVIKANGGYYQGFEIYSPADGSLVENATVTGCGIEYDSWHNTTNTWTIKNSVVNKVTTRSGRTHLVFIDCKFPENMSWALNGDDGGDCFVRIYTSPTCTQPGTIELKRSTAKGTANPYEEEVNNYSAPALGHIVDKETATGVTWENYFENGAYEGVCARCSIATVETTPSADPLFVNRGFSYAQYADATRSMTQLFKVNKEMTKYLENGYDFGVVAMLNEGGAEVSPLEIANMVSASFKELDYDYFNIKITGIPLEKEKTTIVFCAYLVNDGKTYYLNDGTTSNLVSGLTYEIVSKK